MDWPRDLSLYPPYWHSWLKRGFGFGEGASYQPWIRVRDFGSKGSSSNFTGIKIDRPFHFLSSLEATYYLLLERSPDVVDIQEQYPVLDLRGTLRLCAENQLRHPYKGHFPRPVTIDFVVSRRVGARIIPEARSIKTVADAEKATVRARLGIEHQWCAQAGIDWAYIDTIEFTEELLSNLRFMRRWFLDRYVPELDAAQPYADAFNASVEVGTPLEDLIPIAAFRARRRIRDAENLFRYCAWSNLIRLDLRRPLALNHPVILLP